MLLCIRLPNFAQIGAPAAEIWRHIYFSRWRPRPLNTTSRFAFVDVSAFKRSKSISKPNFVDISPFTAKILLLPVWKKQTSAILESYFRFRSRPFRRNRRAILHQAAEFRPNRTTHRGIWRHIDCQNGRRQTCCICFMVMAEHSRSNFLGLNSILKALVRRINRSRDIAMYRFWRFGLKLPIHAPIGEFLGHIFPIWRHPSSRPPKVPSLVGNTSFEPFTVRISATVRRGRVTDKRAV